MADAISLHKKLQGKIEISGKIKIKSEKILRMIYTPGVAKVSNVIKRDKKKIFELTNKRNSVAIITDGSRVLGLGNVGPEAALPVMEGKALIFKEFGNVDAYPICLRTQDENEIVETVKNLSPSFGAINVEDIDSPKSLSITDKLSKELDIPVFHDDQHGTAIVVLAALINALKVVKKKIGRIKIAIIGAGAAGFGIVNILVHAGAKNLVVADSAGVIYRGRKNHMDHYKKIIARKTNPKNVKGGIENAIAGADVIIGVSGRGNLIKENQIRKMKKDAIVFAISNPDPEILPSVAKKAGAKIVATGRSDFENQVNNQLAFPGFVRGLLDARSKKVDWKKLISAAEAIASHVKNPSTRKIVPTVFDKHLCKVVADTVRKFG